MAKQSNGGNRGNNRPAQTTPVRNSAIPRAVTAPSPVQQQQRQQQSRRDPTREQIAKRAFEIYISGRGGSEQENWLRAERELRGGK